MATDANSKISNSYSVGVNHVGSYQSAGIPWMTSSIIYANPGLGTVKTYNFPSVTKSITIKITSPKTYLPGSPVLSEPCAVFFGAAETEAGVNITGIDTFAASDLTTYPAAMKQGHMTVLHFPSSSFSQGIRTKSVNIGFINASGAGITGAVTIYAELTNIPETRMPSDYISGSGINVY